MYFNKTFKSNWIKKNIIINNYKIKKILNTIIYKKFKNNFKI